LPTPDARLPRNALGRAARLSEAEDPWPTIRFPLDVVRAVRAVVPRGVPLGARGLTPDDAVTLGTALKDVGLDFIDVSSGRATAEIRTPTSPGYNAPIAERRYHRLAMIGSVGSSFTRALKMDTPVNTYK